MKQTNKKRKERERIIINPHSHELKNVHILSKTQQDHLQRSLFSKARIRSN
jgi:hypothetical protein